ncbi:hypothetical protein SLA2020_225400 [Shorea laevis]
MASFNYLSEELIMEILSWLLADSLVRFKCLSKSWHSLIGHHWFVTKQLHNHVRSASDNNLCILLRYRICSDQHDPEKGENVLSLLTYNDKMMLSTSKGGGSPYIVKPVTFSLYKDHQYAESWGSCDGIVFFFDSCYMRDTIVIANPVIGEYRILPESCICLPLPALYHGDDNEDYLARVVDAVGLGYDLKSNDYKIVRVWEIESYNDSRQRFPQRAEVYTFSTNSWREINNFVMEVEIDNVVMEACFTPMPSFERYWNGAYYWFVFCYEQGGDTIRKHLIALFDMSDEVFRYIGLPKSCEEQNDNATMCYSLIELNGSLTLFHYPFQVQQKSFDIWGMDKFGVNGIWTKILCIGPLLGIETPLLFGKDDELLMENIEGQLVSYNLKRKQLQRLPIYGETKYFQALLFKRSLVSIHKETK